VVGQRLSGLMATLLKEPDVELDQHPADQRKQASSRFPSVDLLRGTVIILMAVDHAHFFFHTANAVPDYLPGSTPLQFFTRWITHFCAPAFFFLAGTGIFLSLAVGGRSPSEVSRFLWTRGLWLIVVSCTVLGFAWTSLFPFAHGGVIWIFGLSMILMAFLIRLPTRWVAILGVGMMATHNLLDPVSPKAFGSYAVLWSVLHSPGGYSIGGHRYFFSLFTLIPWIGVMAAGYAFGAVLLRQDRRKVMVLLGAAITLAFFVLRGWNHFGNSAAGLRGAFPDYYSAGPWRVQASIAMTIASFFNTLKYPPSLQFLLMTLGPVLLGWAWLDRINSEHRAARVLLVYGRVPLFFYVAHILLLRTMAVWAVLAFHCAVPAMQMADGLKASTSGLVVAQICVAMIVLLLGALSSASYASRFLPRLIEQHPPCFGKQSGPPRVVG